LAALRTTMAKHVLTVILLTSICFLLLGTRLIQKETDAIYATNPKPINEQSLHVAMNPFGSFVRSVGILPGSIVYLSMGDSQFQPELFEAAKLSPFVHMCLDDASIDVCQRHHIVCYAGFIGGSVGRSKFQGVSQLLQAGYHVVLFDLDAFVLHDPLPHMNRSMMIAGIFNANATTERLHLSI
jgi:uncharacterized protein YneF (UPF0154 family)